jgi:HEAT repeat protein
VLRCLTTIAAAAPDAVAPAVDAIADCVTAGDARGLNRRATDLLAALASTHAGALVGIVPALAAVLDDPDPAVRRNVLYALARVAAAYPAHVRPAIPLVAERLDDRVEGNRTNALSTLGRVASAFPLALESTLPRLVRLCRDDSAVVRGNAVGLVGDLARSSPQSVWSAPAAREAVVERLADPDVTVRANAAGATARFAIAFGAAMCDATPALIELLDDPSADVRRHACAALGALESPGARSALRGLAAEDPDASVRRHARWALDRIR